MKPQIALLVMLTLTGCASVDGYVQESRKTKASTDRAKAADLAGALPRREHSNSVARVIEGRLNEEYEREQLVQQVKDGTIPPVIFEGQQHPSYSTLNIRQKLPLDFLKKYSSKGWGIWISWGVEEGTYNVYEDCPMPKRNGMGLIEYHKHLDAWSEKQKREKITCIKEVKPMYQCKASMGIISKGSNAPPEKLYQTTATEKEEMKIEWLRDGGLRQRLNFGGVCINMAMQKMMGDLVGATQ